LYECVRCRAGFAACNIKSGKTVLQFELDAKYQHVIPDLAAITGKVVTLDVSTDQQVIFVHDQTGEITDEPLPLGEPAEDAGPDEEPAEGGEPGEELSEASGSVTQTDATGPDEWVDEEER
jgi:hypothetical protein